MFCIMNISHYTESLNEGGIASFLASLVPIQSKNNIVQICTIFANQDIPTGLKDSSIKILSLNNTQTFLSYLKFPFKVFRHINKSDSEIINIHCSFIYYIIAILLLHNRKRFFYTVHSDAFKEKNSSKLEAIIWPIRRFFFKKGWIKPIAISTQSEDSFYRLYGFHAHIINNGIPIESALPSSEMSSYRNTPNTKLFVHAGRISRAKNQVLMCKVFKRLIDEGMDIHLVIAGGIQDEAIYSELENFWSDRITYLGSRNDVLSLFKSSDFMLLPSIWEGLPISLLEAMSQSCIPVCSPVGGIPSVIRHMENGILMHDSSEDSIYQTLKNVLNLSECQIYRLSIKCLSSVKEFSIDKTAREYLNYYSSK